jgi:hypothetical protein
MIEINLAPDVKQELIKAQRIRNKVMLISIFVGVVSVVVVAMLSINVFAVQAVRNNLADGSIKDKGNSLDKKTDLSKTLTMQNQLSMISDIYDSKNINSRLFDILVKMIPPSPNDVQISTLNINSDTGVISIEGQAKNGFAAFEIFKKTAESIAVGYTDKGGSKQTAPLVVGSLDIGGTSYGQDSTSGAMVLRFTVAFKYSKDIFAVTSKDISINLTSTGNVTDSYLGVPVSIFTAKASDVNNKGVQ